MFSKCLLLKLYKTFVLPHINYCNAVWGTAAPSVLRPLFISQKRALKIALNLHRRTSSTIVFATAKVLSLESLNKLQTNIFMYKYLNEMLPTKFCSKFLCNRDVHKYDTRQSNIYHVPKPRIEIMKQSISYRGPVLWNNLPLKIQQAGTLSCFKSYLKSYLCEKI